MQEICKLKRIVLQHRRALEVPDMEPTIRGEDTKCVIDQYRRSKEKPGKANSSRLSRKTIQL